MSVDRLLGYLEKLGTGKVFNTEELAELLAPIWDEFDGSDESSMQSYKLHGRIEDASWVPPALSFTIERHGQTVLGSSRAELMSWELDLNTMKAVTHQAGFRQLKPRNKPVNTKSLADEISQLIIQGEKSKFLIWNADGTVVVRTGIVLPKDHLPKATVAGRRRRFRMALKEILRPEGWMEIRANVFGKES